LRVFNHIHPLVWVVLGFQLFRLALVPQMGLMPQDAYYALYAHHLDWSYFDHPGMVAYLLYLFEWGLGHKLWAIKLMDWTVSSLGLWVFYLLARQILSKSRALVAAFLWGSSIILSILSLNTTPDVPLLLFWTLSLWSAHKALYGGSKIHWWLMGIWMGLAFQSKYTAVFLPMGLLSILIIDPEQRKQLKRVEFYGAMILALLIASPVYMWNAAHDFASFGFQTTERSGSFGLSTKSFGLLGGFLGSQMLVIYPLVFLTLFRVSGSWIKRLVKSGRFPRGNQLFLAAFFVPTVLGFALLSPFYWVKINWLIPGFVTGLLATALCYKSKWIKWQIGIQSFLHLVLAGQIIFYWIPIRSDDTYWGWPELNKAFEKYTQSYPQHFLFSADNYKTSAVMQWLNPKSAWMGPNTLGKQGLQFGILYPNLDSLSGKNALMIDSEPRFKNLDAAATIPEELQPFFDQVRVLEPILIKDKSGAVLRKFQVYEGISYHPHGSLKERKAH